MDELFVKTLTPRARELFEELQEGAAREGADLPCANAPDLFFPDHEDAIGMKMLAEAKKACLSCPLVQVCAEYAFEADEKFGIWGGFTAGERRTIRYRYGRGRSVSALRPA
jgi:WhiB family redox-sensing transcriptional regulator